ncbi:YqjK-like family protein [Nitrincola alkalilacustris]|uniref:YqjK-like family protein n=1 Tax=Nitrincola alkalilacustris TaxID=1571224 RepID=UPI00124E2770|nr:YqjK-like family protein [Nitrincola alkalilacustris]
MSTGKLSLAQRRARLVAQAAEQRGALGAAVDEWQAPLAMVDQGVSVLRYLRSHPQWVAGVVVLIAAMRSRRSSGVWLRRGWMAWQLINKLRERQ